jgi:glycosyltransferase involved in cell wall biosynthesis
MIGLKLLMSTYSTAFLSVGGGESELVQVADILNKYGFEADIYGITSRPIEYYDAVMHFSVHADGAALYDSYINNGKKIILWPNIWWLNKPSESEIERIRHYTNSAHTIIFKSFAEKHNFTKYMPLDDNKCVVTTICILKSYFSNPDIDLAKTVCDYNKYVLCLGRVEPVKNQIRIIRALASIGLNGIFAGGCLDQQYLLKCKQEGNESVQFLPYIKPCSALLVSLIAGSQAVIEVGYDPSGRSSLEAALLGKPLVLSNDEWTNEYFGNTVYKANPDSVDEIAGAIKSSLHDRGGENKYKKAMSHVADEYASSSALDNFVTVIVDACDR